MHLVWKSLHLTEGTKLKAKFPSPSHLFPEPFSGSGHVFFYVFSCSVEYKHNSKVFMPLFLFFLIEIWLTYSTVLVLGVQCDDLKYVYIAKWLPQ